MHSLTKLMAGRGSKTLVNYAQNYVHPSFSPLNKLIETMPESAASQEQTETSMWCACATGVCVVCAHV